MRSPICNLNNQIAGAPFTSAPEKEPLCVIQRDEFRITIVLVDERNFGIRVRKGENGDPEIVLPIASLEYLWAFSLYCYVLAQEYAISQNLREARFDCVGNDRLRGSFSLLEWAKQNLANSGTERWPEGAPRPRSSPQEFGDDEHVASEIFLCSLAWMLHHEIAHVVLKHPFLSTSLSQKEERDADQFATSWLLDGLEQRDPMLRKRSFGIAIAVLCLQSLEDKAVDCLKNTHPSAHERIFSNLSAYNCGNDELIEATCCVVLQFLFKDTDVTANVDAGTFSEILNDMLFDISRTKNSWD